MEIVQKVAVFIVAFIHLLFLYLEMFLWKTPKGQKIFKIDEDFSNKSAALAANMGLYNGFLSAGLIWSLITTGQQAYEFKIFFLVCIIIAGTYGSITVSRNILKLQAIPALIALLLVVFG